MSLFTAQYAPKNSSQVFGQDKAVQELKDFILHYKNKVHKAALLLGPLGNGKTSSVYALAKELDYDLLEINSSELRDEKNMGPFLRAALGQQSLFFRPKIVLVDEIDNTFGTYDRGCLPTLLKTMENSPHPLILTANDVSDSKFKALRKQSQLIEFHKLQYRTIAHALRWVCEQEGISFEEKAVDTLARRAEGDLRGALIDLQICSLDKSFAYANLSSLSDRKRTESILNALTIIFKSSSAENALPALEEVDMDLSEVIYWLDESLPKEYLEPHSLARAYEYLSRADVFQGRITRQQHWRFLVYINNLLTAGISTAKESKNTQVIPYVRTMRFLRMWQAKMKFGKKKEIAAKLAKATHTSEKTALQQVPYFQLIFRKTGGEEMARELKLTDEEAEWLRQ